MKQTNLTFQNIERWITTARAHSPQLEMEADSRLGRMSYLSTESLTGLACTPMTLGLYGYSTEGKHHLLGTFLAEDGGWPSVQLGDKTLNYLLHINPGVSPKIAVRFTHTATPSVENYPLFLELFSESELAIKLIQRYHAREDARTVAVSDMVARITALQAYRLPKRVQGLTLQQCAAVTKVWQNLMCNDSCPDDGLLYQMAELAEWLSPGDRASLLGLLWGDDPSVTAAWETLANALAQIGNHRQLLAPASLVVDDFRLPAEGFLFPASPGGQASYEEVLVCPLRDGKPEAPVSINRQLLASICLCVTFKLSNRPPLGNIDIVDIPNGELDTYSRRLLPDTLLLCNVLNERHTITPTANMLSSWLDSTQGDAIGTLPRLVWAVTPFDQRFSNKGHLDEGVQRLLSRAGKNWGILQVLDKQNHFRLSEWLTGALDQQCREQRTEELKSLHHAQLHTQLSGLLTPLVSTTQEVENLVRGLQAQASHFGELASRLTLSREDIYQCWLQFQQKPMQTLTPELMLDLFSSDNVQQPTVQNDSLLANLIYQRWVNHLRQLSWRSKVINSLEIPAERLAALSDVLIATAHQQGLQVQLEHALAPYENNMALAITCAGNVLSDFISWLGYQHIPLAQRPMSKVNPEMAIFAPAEQASADQRLTTLGEQQFFGHIRYIYDWLVALYNRGIEYSAQPQHSLPLSFRQSLKALFPPNTD